MRNVEAAIDINKLSIDDILAVISLAGESVPPADQMKSTLPYVKKCLPQDMAMTLSGVEALRAFRAFSDQVAKAIGSDTGADDLGN